MRERGALGASNLAGALRAVAGRGERRYKRLLVLTDGRITAGINNLFDEDPPVSYSTFGNSFDPAYDIPARFAYLRYAQRF